MELFRSISRRNADFQPLPEPNHESPVLNNSPLRQLLPEILLCIAAFLPVKSAAAFSICCRFLLSKLGTRYLNAMKHGFYAYDQPDEYSLATHSWSFWNAICQTMFCIVAAKSFTQSTRSFRDCAQTGSFYTDAYQAGTIYYHAGRAEPSGHYRNPVDDPLFAGLQMIMKLYRQGYDYSRL